MVSKEKRRATGQLSYLVGGQTTGPAALTSVTRVHVRA